MPWIIRDTAGAIKLFSVDEIERGEQVGFDDPDLRSYLQSAGVDLKAVDSALVRLAQTDSSGRLGETALRLLLSAGLVAVNDIPSHDRRILEAKDEERRALRRALRPATGSSGR